MKKIIGLKPDTVIEIIASLFILLFLYTALSKTFRIDTTVDVLKRTSFFSKIAETTAWSVVISEYIITILLFLPHTRKAGLYAAITLMSCFTVYISYMMAFSPRLPCTCGGVISKMTWAQHLIFNIACVVLALSGVLLERKRFRSKQQKTESPILFT